MLYKYTLDTVCLAVCSAVNAVMILAAAAVVWVQARHECRGVGLWVRGVLSMYLDLTRADSIFLNLDPKT